LVTDYEGNSYSTIEIGTQTWMAENLKSAKFNDGTNIPLVPDSSDWEFRITPAYCWYNNDSANYWYVYGALYNWYSINTAKLCPTNWHVPSDEEWKTLEISLGMPTADAESSGWRGTDQGTQLKSNSGWNSNEVGANISGFTGLPGGFRFYNGKFDNFGGLGHWWSATEFNYNIGWFRALISIYTKVYRNGNPKQTGFSVRCIRN
jgi:uncharacterized protein (TIGR02145 family)